MKIINLKIEDIFGDDQNFTFLIGAGCSIDASSCQPVGKSMMDAILYFSCGETEIEKIKKLKNSRFEALVEILRDNLDEDLQMIDYYGLCDRPNIQHFFLADLISQKHKGNN